MSTVANPNVLRSDVDYIVQETANGVWRSYLYPNGTASAHQTSFPIRTSARKSAFQPAICILPRMLSFIG